MEGHLLPSYTFRSIAPTVLSTAKAEQISQSTVFAVMKMLKHAHVEADSMRWLAPYAADDGKFLPL